ncbi:MAG: hypothetical protein R3C03_15850 [Pirellulaceae bacterium]
MSTTISNIRSCWFVAGFVIAMSIFLALPVAGQVTKPSIASWGKVRSVPQGSRVERIEEQQRPAAYENLPNGLVLDTRTGGILSREFVSDRTAEAQPQSEDSSSPRVQDILEIRRRLGGSVIQFDDPALNAMAETAFIERCRMRQHRNLGRSAISEVTASGKFRASPPRLRKGCPVLMGLRSNAMQVRLGITQGAWTSWPMIWKSRSCMMSPINCDRLPSACDSPFARLLTGPN